MAVSLDWPRRAAALLPIPHSWLVRRCSDRLQTNRLAELELGKRRCKWLIGRWTAKHLFEACLERDLKLRLPLNAIGIYNDARGAPVVMVDCGSRIAE